MGEFWALLFLTGLVVRPLLILASFAIVVYLAIRIAPLEKHSTATLVLAASHLVLVVGSEIVTELIAASSGSVAPWAWLPVAAGLAVPAVLWWRFRYLLRAAKGPERTSVAKADDQWLEVEDTAESEVGFAAEPNASHIRSATRIAWVIGVTGSVAPWLVGLGVKFYLQSIGRPTLPVASFLDPVALPLLVVATLVMWSFPFLALALVARFWVLGQRKPAVSFRSRVFLVWLTYGFGMAVTLPVFVSVFWQFDTLYLFVPIGLFICPFMALGCGVGLLTIRRAQITG